VVAAGVTPLPLVLRKIFILYDLGPDLVCKVFILKGWVRIMGGGRIRRLALHVFTDCGAAEVLEMLLNMSELPEWLQRPSGVRTAKMFTCGASRLRLPY
jgi:hypothetical protein